MRYTLALAFVVCLFVSSVAFAQESVVVVAALGQQQRQGTFQTGSVTVPMDAVGDLRITLDVNTADYDAPGNTIRYRLYRFDAPAGVWRLYVGGSWISGHVEDPELGTNPASSVSTNLIYLRGQQIRGEIDTVARMRYGCTVEIVTTP